MIDRPTRALIAASAIAAPALHPLSNVMEWWGGGYATGQLVVNYAAFALTPFMAVGLYAAQRPAISRLGLAVAVLYGGAFVYFAHTALLALYEAIPDYERLLADLGATYVAHGAAMVAGGTLLAVTTVRAGLLPPWTGLALLAGAGAQPPRDRRRLRADGLEERGQAHQIAAKAHPEVVLGG